jgi:iron complex outermembrane receptor protein
MERGTMANNMIGRGAARALLLTTALGTGIVAASLGSAVVAPAHAQATVRSFSIARQPLGSALRQFADQSGMQLAYRTADLSGLTSPGVTGAMSPTEALAALLRGTGVTYGITAANTVTIQRPTATPAGGAVGAAPAGAIELDTIDVAATADGTSGYVATRSDAGTKTDTPIIEVPQSISVVTAEQITAQAAQSINATLRYTPGISSEQNGMDPRGYGFQIRGIDAGDDAFFRDGLAMPGTQFSSFLTLDPFGAERIEVLRGPNSVLYGQANPGGIINYVTKRPTETPFAEVEILGGSFDQIQGQFDVGGPLTEDKTWLYRLTGLARDGQTFVDFVDADRVFIAPALTWRPNADTTFTILANYQEDRTGWSSQFLPALGTVLPNQGRRIPVNRFVGEPGWDQYDLTQASIGYEFEHNFNETLTVRQKARYSYLHNEQKGVFGWGLDANDSSLLNRSFDQGKSTLGNFATDNQLQANLQLGDFKHTVLVGLDYQYNDYSDDGWGGPAFPIDIFDPVYGEMPTAMDQWQDSDITMSQVGLYAQDQISFGKFVATLGGRQDWVTMDTFDPIQGIDTRSNDDNFSGRAGLVYLADNGLAPYVSYGQSFQQPIGIDIDGNPLKPETGEQWEFGIKYQPLDWNAFITVSAFELTRSNLVRTDTNGDPFQTGEVRSRGIEVEAVASLADGLSLRAAYTYLDTEITDDADPANIGNTPYGVPRNKAGIWADYTFQRGAWQGFGFGGGVRYTGWTWADDANTLKVPSYTLFDATVHYDWKNFRFALNATNLFDKTYVASCYNADVGCFYGEPRKVLASIRYRW